MCNDWWPPPLILPPSWACSTSPLPRNPPPHLHSTLSLPLCLSEACAQCWMLHAFSCINVKKSVSSAETVSFCNPFYSLSIKLKQHIWVHLNAHLSRNGVCFWVKMWNILAWQFNACGYVTAASLYHKVPVSAQKVNSDVTICAAFLPGGYVTMIMTAKTIQMNGTVVGIAVWGSSRLVWGGIVYKTADKDFFKS